MALIEFKHACIIGQCIIDEDFEPQMKIISCIANNLGLRLLITSSFRNDSNVKGAIVEPAKKSNHMIGHAIDCNIYKGSTLYNSAQMASPTGIVKQFIDGVKKAGIRWGGDFKAKDPVHFDDAINVTNPELWQEKYKTINNLK